MAKKNCWEFMKCGREPGGRNIDQLGVCLAATCKDADGLNDGINAGRCCWVVAGTYCRGKVQGTFAQKMVDCLECPFFKFVAEEEDNFMTSNELLEKIKEK